MKRLWLAGLLLASAGTAAAEPTRIMVRAHSADAKFIGDQMGGVQVTLRDVRTGRTLAQGRITGGTGDTARIVRTPRARGAQISDAATAGYEATIDIDTPTLVEVEAVGPMGKPGSAVRVTSQSWVIPGRHVTGDGWVLPFPGLVIEPDLAAMTGPTPTVRAKVSLMCGCPIEPGGLWNADNYAVSAELLKGKEVVARASLTYAGTASQFAGAFAAAPRGGYQMRIVATDSQTPNAGVWEGPVTLR